MVPSGYCCPDTFRKATNPSERVTHKPTQNPDLRRNKVQNLTPDSVQSDTCYYNFANYLASNFARHFAYPTPMDELAGIPEEAIN